MIQLEVIGVLMYSGDAHVFSISSLLNGPGFNFTLIAIKLKERIRDQRDREHDITGQFKVVVHTNTCF